MSISNKVDALPPLREVVAQHGLQANKAFGQNYLFDLNLTKKIASLAKDLDGQTVFEIGPGPGGLTRALVGETNAKQIIAIEKDTRFIEALQPLIDLADGKLQLIEGDALKTNPVDLAPAPRAVIANLPYNVGTELLISWLHQPLEYTQFILMFQREVAERIVAKKNTKAYGRLAVLVQNLCTAEIAMKVPASAFTPPPKVTSSIVRLKPKPEAKDVPIKELEAITAAAFGQRRKMLRQSMKAYLPVLEELKIDPQLRAEDLSIEQYLTIANLVHNNSV
jgi:16S rRNA (adenine1518-N6/adenine1519-N6)-dimethyltransferase